jgi:hypothetical protein
MSQENVEIVQQALGHFQQTGEPLWDTVDPKSQGRPVSRSGSRPIRQKGGLPVCVSPDAPCSGSGDASYAAGHRRWAAGLFSCPE